MTRCTEPERWAKAPGVGAAEEDVVDYLSHVSTCPFHAAIEQREEAHVRGVVALALRDSLAPGSEPRARESAINSSLDTRAKRRRRASGRTLSIRVDGVEMERIDLTARREAALEVEAGALVAVWRTGVDEEVYLMGVLLPTGGRLTDAKEVSETALEDGHRLILTTEAGAGARTRLTVAYAANGWLRARHLSVAQLTRAGRAPASGRSPVPRLVAALCALAAALVLVLTLFPQPERPGHIARQKQPQPTGVEPMPRTPEPQRAPSAEGAQSQHDVAPVAPPVVAAPSPTPAAHGLRGSWRGNHRPAVPSPSQTREQLTIGTVRRIYVSAEEGDDDRQLREALIERLQAGHRFIVVLSEQQADAVLLREQSRGASVSVQLVTRTGKTLWFTTTATGDDDLGDLAARLVAALTTAADKYQPPVKAPRR